MFLVDTTDDYSVCTDQMFVYEISKKFFTDLAHEIIDNTIDGPPEINTKAKRPLTAKNSVLANLELPHLKLNKEL